VFSEAAGLVRLSRRSANFENRDRRSSRYMVVPQFAVGTFASSIERRCVKKRQVLDVIDIGCADGNFYLNHYALRLLSGSSAVNIDAKPVIEAGFGLFDLAGRQWSDPRLVLACRSQPQARSSRKPSGTRRTLRRSSRSKPIDARQFWNRTQRC
jgi:hypothetical protein